jgi:hypothetical protein
VVGLGTETYDCGILEIDLPWLDERIEYDFAGGHFCLIDLGLGLKGRFPGLQTEAASASQEDVRCGGFGEEEEHHDAYWCGEPQ